MYILPNATDFNNEDFWDWCREIIETKENIKLLISEYNAPDDFVCIWQKDVQRSMKSTDNTMRAVEKLFTYKGGLYERSLNE